LLSDVVLPIALQEALEQRAREVQVAHADENHQMLKDAVRLARCTLVMHCLGMPFAAEQRSRSPA
jgi:hypothetical protein